MKNPLASKSIWFGVMVTALGVFEYLEKVPEVPRWAMICIGAVIVALRMMTTQPVLGGKKERNRDEKGRFVSSAILFSLLVSGCSTLSVSAKKTADCKFKVTNSVHCGRNRDLYADRTHVARREKLLQV
jgi:hypothetical protein